MISYYQRFACIHLLTGGSDQNAKKNEQVTTDHSLDLYNDDCRMDELPHRSINLEGILIPNTVACDILNFSYMLDSTVTMDDDEMGNTLSTSTSSSDEVIIIR